MPIVSGKYVNPNWVNNSNPAIDQAELNDMSNTLAKVPVANGGTGADNAADARTNLGITLGNLGALAANGGVATNLRVNSWNSNTVVPIANGGTGATTAAQARTNLGIGNLATLSFTVVTWEW